MNQVDHGLPPTGAAAIFDGTNGQKQLLSALCYQFVDHSLLETALTHPSTNAKRNNQRLEFVGDAVLQLVISEQLYKSSREAEGKLTFRRQRLVNERTLVQVARSIRLGECLFLGRSFDEDGGRELDSVLADAMEALLAAIYFDGGLPAVKQVVHHLFEGHIQTASASLDAKGALQAYFQARGESEPEYLDISCEGPPHRPVFTVAVRQAGSILAQGRSSTKRGAQQKAAEAALEQIKQGGQA